MKSHWIETAGIAFGAAALLFAASAAAQYVDCAAGKYTGFTDYELFPKTPRIDCTFGQTVNMAVARQIIDKDAGAKNAAKRVPGIDGAAARSAIEQYQKSFAKPEPPPSAMIQSVGTTSSSNW